MSGGDEAPSGAVPGPVAWIAGLAALAGALAFLRPERMDATSLSLGVLLLAAALAFLAVAVGGRPYGPDTAGRLDLSTRLATGALGGALGGIAFLVAAWLLEASGIPSALGVGLRTRVSAAAVGGPMASGTAWGVVLGVLVPWLPGGTLAMRGALFSLVPALYVLLRVFPEDFKYGVFGVELGVLTFVPVVLYHLVWGVTAASVVAWAETTELGPLSRPLGA